jgi:hypothetical protein
VEAFMTTSPAQLQKTQAPLELPGAMAHTR